MSYPHWPLPQRIAWDHSPVHAPGKSGCKCGAQVTDEAWIAHVVEVTEAEVRETVAKEIERKEFDRSLTLGESWDGEWRTEHERGAHYGLSTAYRAAARIARGEVAA